MNRELLEKPFSPEQIKQRDGNFGKKLDYIEGHAVIQRLNDAFEGEWSFAILEHEILEATDEVVVLGELKAGEVVKTQFGSSRITRARESGEMVSLADDFKAAGTDALKKCATLLGVGLFLYNGNKSARQSCGARSGGNGGNGGSRNGNGGNKGSRSGNGGNGNTRLSSRQFKYIVRLADEAGLSKSDIDQQTLQMFGSTVQFLCKADASAYIEQLLPR
jgi:hypothetical protein